jgi:aspartate 1-decarboxylase
MVQVLRCKIHRARVTGANVRYVGSISIGSNFMERVGLQEFEKVLVCDITNGERLETYVIKGKRGEIRMNGAAAKRIGEGDLVTIMAFGLVEEGTKIKPKIVNF